jgi:hypothetical protein
MQFVLCLVGCLCMHVFLADVATGERDSSAVANTACVFLCICVHTLRRLSYLISIFLTLTFVSFRLYYVP